MEIENDLVSIIMPAYNSASYIEKAINSVQMQNVNWELIIIDDASKDNTEKVIQPYLKDERIRYYRNGINVGVSESRNRGVSYAKGEYVAFLDADDWWEAEKLEKQLVKIKETNAILCCTARKMYDDGGEDLQKQVHVKENITYKQLLYGNSIACSSVLMKTEVALEFPMSHDEYHEDYMTWLRCLEKYSEACGIDEPLLCYRLSNNGKSRKRLKSIKMTYGMHRCMGKNVLQAVYYTGCHLISAIKKYGKADRC